MTDASGSPIAHRRPLDLADRAVLVTGAGAGIGAATAERLASRGATVFVADIDVRRAAEVTGRLHGRGVAIELDVADEASWERVVAEARDRAGGLDGLVNNAGVWASAPLESMQLALWNHIIAVNQTGCFLGMRAVVDSMRSRGGGSIVNISSNGALRGNRTMVAYTAAKWALRGMTRTAAVELGQYGIRVNVVLPGATETGISGIPDDDQRMTFFRSLPLGRRAQPDDIADVIAFLVSDDSRYCTGSELLVDGGMTAGMSLPSASS